MNIQPYVRRTHYYETDAMAIIHHSNYIRWFEEARVDLMNQVGFTYARMEAEGVASPLLAVSCEYKTMVRFGETVRVIPTIAQFTGAKMTVLYRVEDAETGELRTVGETRHGFTLISTGRPVSLKKANPELYKIMTQVMEYQAQRAEE